MMCCRGSYFIGCEFGEAEECGLGLKCGYVDVVHSDETVKRVSDKRGAVAKEVKLYYETTVDIATGPTKGHIVLVPGTGTTTRIYRRGSREEHFMGMLIDAGYEVTAFDLRGHGLSSVPKGPYTVDVLAADIAHAVKELFNGQACHFFGLSVGFGTCMSLVLDYPEIAKSLAGSGFLFDRTRKDFAAWFFSRPIVIRALGMRILSSAAQFAMKIRNKGLMYDEMRYVKIDGFIHTSSAWLGFNRKPSLPKHHVPTLILVPQYDEDIGHKRKYFEEEISLMPEGVAEMEYFAGFSHVMLIEKTKDGIGAELLKNRYLEFLKTRGF